jgi:hypothetical protein
MSASPLATGGAGVDFETDVATSYLAALLLGAPARGAAAGATVRVALQRGAQDAPLDDVVVETATPVGPVRLDLQVKRTFTFAPGEPEFASVLEACWATFRLPEFGSPASRFGVAIGHFPVRVKAHYSRVPDWARTSASATEFFFRISQPGVASNEMRTFVGNVVSHLRAHVGSEASDEGLWRFFQRLVIVDYDFEQAASRDRAFTIDALRHLVPGGELARAEAVFAALREIVRQIKLSGGSLTAVELRSRLLSYPIELLSSPSCQADLERIAEHTGLVLGGIRTTIGGVTLDRSEVVADVLDRVDRGRVVLVTGAPGTGKSAVLRMAAETRRADGAVVALTADRLEGVSGWNGLSVLLRLERRLGELVATLSGAGRPCLVIDGVDRIEDVGTRHAINDLLTALFEIPTGPEGSLRWSLILTVRTDGMETVRNWITLPAQLTEVVTVSELTEDDLVALIQQLPPLGWVLRAPELGPVVRNPLFLSVLDQARAAGPEATPSAMATEADVSRIWWERVVGRDTGRARQQALLSLGERVLAERVRRLIPQGVDPAPLRDLEQDGILRRDPGTDTYWFGHDIFEEWIVARVLAQHNDNVVDFLRSLGRPFWAARALQLLACGQLEEGADGVERWRTLLTQAERHPESDDLWIDAILSAPLRSARLGELLPRIEERLLEGDAARLATLLRVVRTRWLVPNTLLEPVLAQLPSVEPLSLEERATLLLELGIPWLPIWHPIVEWLAPRLQQLPPAARDEASRVMLAWQRTPYPGQPFRREIAEAALAWRSVLIRPSGERVIVSSGAESYFDRLRDIITLSADVVPDRIPAFLAQLRQTKTEHELAMWIAQSTPASIVQHTPAAYVDFALDVLVPDWRLADSSAPRESLHTARPVAALLGRGDPKWERLQAYGSAFLHPSHLRGPFLLLLRVAEPEGLRLVKTLVHHATAAWFRELAHRGETLEAPLALQLSGGLQTFHGDGRVYQWFRPNGNAPYPAAAALMALEFWMEQEVERGRDPEELFHTVLTGSDSTAVVGVCVALALAYPDRCLRAVAPMIMAPLVWEYDIARAVSDRMGTVSMSHLFGPPDPFERASLQRDQRPQRRLDVRELVPWYLFGTTQNLSDKVVQAVRRFPDDLSPLMEQDRQDPGLVQAYRRHAENYAALGDRANYRQVQTPSGEVGWLFEPPKELQEQNAPIHERYLHTGRVAGLHLWAEKTIETGLPDAALSVPDAMRLARELSQTDDFTRPIVMDGDALDTMRLDAIVGTATAALRADPAWLQNEGELQWCLSVLLAAAHVPRAPDDIWDGLAARGVQEKAARGLLLLVERGLANESVRLAVLELLRRGDDRVADAVFDGVRRAWDTDRVLCRNLVTRELALATFPRGAIAHPPEGRELHEANRRARLEELEAAFQSAIVEGRQWGSIRLAVPTGGSGPVGPGAEDLSTVVEVHTSRVSRTLRGVPLERVADGTERDWVVELIETIVAWTISQCRLHDDDPRKTRVYSLPFGWADFVGGWLGWLASVLPAEEVQRRFLTPLRESWPASAVLTSGLLTGLIKHQLVKDSIPQDVGRLWRRVAEWVIPEVPLEAHRWTFLGQDQEEALDLLIHVRHGRAVLTEQWHNAREFTDVYDRWVAHVAHCHDCFRALVTFLGAGGSHLDASTVIIWLSSSVSRAVERHRLWSDRETGAVTAQLLARLWSTAGSGIRNNQAVLSAFVGLLDELARAGVPLAARVRAEI